MGPTVRLRFVALDLPLGWIELSRVGVWKLAHPDRKGDLAISMFPVAAGVTMDLPTLGALLRQRQEKEEESNARIREHLKKNPELRREAPFHARTLRLEQTSWLEGSLFCTGRQTRTDGEPASFRAEWTVSDGTYVLEATLHESSEAHFRLGATEWDAVMHTLRFEGPS